MPSSREIFGMGVFNPGLPSYPMRDPREFEGRHPDIHICLRIYPNGEWKVEPRTTEEIGPTDDTAWQDSGWYGHNVFWRWANALFIDGKCVRRGLLSDERAAWIEARLARGEKPTDYGQIEPGVALWGKNRMAYATVRDIYTTRTLLGAWVVTAVEPETLVLQRLTPDRKTIVGGDNAETYELRLDDLEPITDWQRAGRYQGDLPE